MDQPICGIHGMNVRYTNKNNSSKRYCEECLKEAFNLIPPAEFERKVGRILQNIMSFLQYLGDTVCEDLNQFAEKLNQISKEVKQIAINYKKEINNNYLVFQRLERVELNVLKGLFNSFITSISSLLQKTVIKEQIYELNTFFQKIEDKQNNLLQQIKKVELPSDIIPQIEVHPIQVICNKIQQWEVPQYCKALSVNNEGNTLAVAYEQQIIIYSLEQGMFKEQQRLKDHTKRIFCLEFTRTCDKLISASKPDIIIWGKNQAQKWQKYETLLIHTDSIYALICNKNENIIISGSKDKTINFQKKEYKQWERQQVIEFNSPVLSLSLNESESKLVSSLKEDTIYVLELNTQKQWCKSQIIDVSSFGLRISFINDKEFVFQQKALDSLEVYEFNDQTKKFLLTKKVSLPQNDDNDEWLFPIKFIKHHQLLVHKNGNSVHFIQRLDGQYKFLESLNFKSQFLYGTITQNGEYLITWDMDYLNNSSQKIQVWQIKIQ